MRTTDDLNPEPPFKPFGDRVLPLPTRTSPAPTPPAGPYGVVIDHNGMRKTTLDNLPKGTK